MYIYIYQSKGIALSSATGSSTIQLAALRSSTPLQSSGNAAMSLASSIHAPFQHHHVFDGWYPIAAPACNLASATIGMNDALSSRDL
jgi:hypothetical protein